MTTVIIADLTQLPAQWGRAAGAWLAEVGHRTGSSRTPQEYGRHLARFLARLEVDHDDGWQGVAQALGVA